MTHWPRPLFIARLWDVGDGRWEALLPIFSQVIVKLLTLQQKFLNRGSIEQPDWEPVVLAHRLLGPGSAYSPGTGRIRKRL